MRLAQARWRRRAKGDRLTDLPKDSTAHSQRSHQPEQQGMGRGEGEGTGASELADEGTERRQPEAIRSLSTPHHTSR